MTRASILNPSAVPMHVVAANHDLTVRRLVETALVQLGHTVTLVSDGESAWTAITRERPALVLLDWHMPGLSGPEVCRRIRASGDTRGTFVLVVAARDHPTDLLAALDAGADDYLTSPLDGDRLRARLLIAGRRVQRDAERRATVAELARLRRVADVGEMAIALQHDVNNPLAALTLDAQLLERSPGLSAEQREIAAEIVEQARRISAMVRRISTARDPQRVEYVRSSPIVDLGDAPA